MKYIPTLLSMSGCEVVGLCDSSETLTDKITASYGLNEKVGCTSIEELVQKKPELVFVLTHEHYEISKELLESGINVCVEKPLCWEIGQIQELIEVAGKHNVNCYAAYMKQFDDNFRKFKELILDKENLLCLNVKCYAGNNKLWADKQYDIKKAASEEKKEAKTLLEKKWNSYFDKKGITEIWREDLSKLLLQLGIHQLNLLNHLCESLKVEDAKFYEDQKGQIMNASFGTEGNYPVNFTLIPCFSGAWLWEEKYEAVFSDKIVTYSVGSPFLRSNESFLEITDMTDGTMRTQRLRCDVVEPFERMLEALLAGENENLGAEQAITDLTLIKDILGKIEAVNA